MDFTRREQLLILVLVVVIIIAGGVYAWRESHPPAPPAHDAAADRPARPSNIVVYVSGAVQKMGVVQLPAGARVIDALNACGGVTAEADVNAVNLAAPLADGQQVHVPARVAASPAPAAAVSPAGGKININTADKTALDSLPGIGPALAQRIIDYRTAHGHFKTIEDIKNVPGIGEQKFNQMKDRLTVY